MKTFKKFVEEITPTTGGDHHPPTMSTGPAIDLGEPPILFKKRRRKRLLNKKQKNDVNET